ncbi:hypothetical protein GCM10010096_13160 [Alcaligenes pakistanensis]|uniref:DUF2783 domain-containing protein n=1 Tax=Alcaligenes pakistanensis TaxID=1482717 RepID=A0A8H9IMU3_9BURK|nr:DUF2783 domain-containing protein [Alcaligenes pakistanensis]MBP6623511.1 DUF2783 domain-containing protein [Alcaligenes sp.]GHC43464.1 hypothetical protein GCM10010096_13160 [Alcaligenes pakistanensis]HCA16690.1 DNA topoisomerase IV [Alcaligenes faecalis]
MSTLNTDTPLERADDFYQMLIDAHHGLSTAQSHAMNAALVLLLCNHVGSLDVIKQALDAARQTCLEQAA